MAWVQVLRRADVKEYFNEDGSAKMEYLGLWGYQEIDFVPDPDVIMRQPDLQIVGTKTRYDVPTVTLIGFPAGPEAKVT